MSHAIQVTGPQVEVLPGQDITVTVDVTNVGIVGGTFRIKGQIVLTQTDEVVETMQTSSEQGAPTFLDVTLAPNESDTLNFVIQSWPSDLEDQELFDAIWNVELLDTGATFQFRNNQVIQNVAPAMIRFESSDLQVR